MISADAPGPVRVPAGLEALAARHVGAPFLAKGETPAGWDCKGCVRWHYRELLQVHVESYAEAYTVADVMTRAGRAVRSRLIAERLGAWRPVPAQAGAVAQLSWLGRAGHVALMLSPDRFLHADPRCGTVIQDLRAPGQPYRPQGFFVPPFVTELIQEAR